MRHVLSSECPKHGAEYSVWCCEHPQAVSSLQHFCLACCRIPLPGTAVAPRRSAPSVLGQGAYWQMERGRETSLPRPCRVHEPPTRDTAAWRRKTMTSSLVAQ